VNSDEHEILGNRLQIRRFSNLEERVVESKRIYEGRVVNLREDSLLLPDGRRFAREVVEHKGCVAALPFLDQDTIVLVKQYRHPTGEVLLEIPAGTIQSGEDPEDCMRRELIEETGYRPRRLEALLTLYLAPGYSSELARIYLATDLVELKVNPDEDEFIEVVALHLSKALEMVFESKIRDAKTACTILWYCLAKGRTKRV